MYTFCIYIYIYIYSFIYIILEMKNYSIKLPGIKNLQKGRITSDAITKFK